MTEHITYFTPAGFRSIVAVDGTITEDSRGAFVGTSISLLESRRFYWGWRVVERALSAFKIKTKEENGDH